MALTATEWNEIAVLYKIGEVSIRDIATQFGITHGAIQQRAKRENWERGSLKSVVNQLAKQTSQISQLVTPEQVPIIGKIIRDKTELKEIVTNVISASVELQQAIINGTLIKLSNGIIDELQAARVIQSMGLSFETLAKTSGINLKDDNEQENNRIIVQIVEYGKPNTTVTPSQ